MTKIKQAKRYTALILFFYFLSGPLVAQKTRTRKQDSAALGQTTVLILKTDSIHHADSIRRAALVRQIEKLKDSEGTQRSSLLAKLRAQEILDSARKATQLEQLEYLKANSIGYPVSPFSDTLFFVYTRIGSFLPAERAQSISERIDKLYDNYAFQPDSLEVFNGESSSEIIYKDLVVMSVNELEALWHNKSANELSREYRNAIVAAIKEERDANSLRKLLLRISALILVVVGIYFFIKLINRLFRKLRLRVFRMKDDVIRGIRFKGYQFLDSGREVRTIIFLINIFRFLIIVTCLYIALPLMFSVFPWTEGIADTLIGWVLTPAKALLMGLFNYLPNLFAIIVIVVITHYASRFLTFIAGEIESGALALSGFYPDWAKPTLNIVKFLLYAFSFIIIFPYLPGSDSPIFRGVSVFVGILFSLGSSSAISNAVAGLVITYMRPFRVGDRIKIGEISGDVIAKTLLVTRIRTIKNEVITVPNASILSGYTINYTTSAKDLGLILHTSVTIGYDVPWKQVHELLISAALATNRVMSDDQHRPFVLQTSLDDFYVAYQLNAYTDQSTGMVSIYSEIHQNIQDKFNEAGVEIMSPHYRAARDGNATAIPPGYLGPDYQSPPFKFSVKDKHDEK